jgi:hypothetical protein
MEGQMVTTRWHDVFVAMRAKQLFGDLKKN